MPSSDIFNPVFRLVFNTALALLVVCHLTMTGLFIPSAIGSECVLPAELNHDNQHEPADRMPQDAQESEQDAEEENLETNARIHDACQYQMLAGGASVENKSLFRDREPRPMPSEIPTPPPRR